MKKLIIPVLLKLKRTLLVSIFVAAVNCAAFDAAPFFEWETVENENSWRALGPFFEYDPAWMDEWRLTALMRPVWTQFEHREEDKSGYDLLWPLCLSRQRKEQLMQRFLLAVHTNQDIDDPNSGSRWWLIPVIFTGKNSETGNPYFALFPVGGRIDDFIGYDTMNFALFPLYLSTHKGQQRTQSFLWPIFSRTEGPQVHKWRVFPIYGRADTENASRQFILWPFLHLVQQKADPRSGVTGKGFFLLPFYGQFVQWNREGEQQFRSWTALWPFFSGEKGPNHSRLYCPWPFLQFVETEAGERSRRKFYVWPVFGTYDRPDEKRRFMLWPFWQDWNIGQEDEGRRVQSLFPFYWSVVWHEDGEKTDVYRRFWPLFHYEGSKAKTEFRMLSLWPQRNVAAINRNYMPLWTLYRYERNGSQRMHDLLWGLWQHETASSRKEISLFPIFDYERSEDAYTFSLLKGLLGWGRQNDDPQGRLLWFIKW